MATYPLYARKSLLVYYLFIISCCRRFCFSHGRSINPNFRVRAVNLGGWLLTEGWIKPSLFDDIPNKDFLDGTGLQFKSVTVGKYLCAELGGGTIIVANRTAASGWETFKVFIMQTGGRLEGEFQVTNGYGPIMAPQVMREHWDTFIVEEDFRFIASNGLNAVRIPVGWWIASDPTPPKPYVGGSLQALDKAFLRAGKYGLKVIIDLHAAPGSQNPWEHGANRDGTIEWGKSDDTIQRTVAIIDSLTHEVTLDMVKKFYEAGYNAVRKHSSTAYVLLSFSGGLKGYVIDVHYYNLFSTYLTTCPSKKILILSTLTDLAQLTTITQSNGPLTFVGCNKGGLPKFAKAQLKVFERATFGWAYWTLKNVNNHWSMEWMIKNGYIKL
ncbi:unnamed protein product [Withania somnifera]